MKFKLPEGIHGDTILLQWYYLTANSCKHEGYSEYNFPNDWVGVFDDSLPDCGEIPPDGNGVPEQVRQELVMLFSFFVLCISCFHFVGLTTHCFVLPIYSIVLELCRDTYST